MKKRKKRGVVVSTVYGRGGEGGRMCLGGISAAELVVVLETAYSSRG